MISFQELYKRVLDDTLSNKEIKLLQEYDPLHLDCLLYPEKQPLIWKTDDCGCEVNETPSCIKACLFDAIVPDEKGGYKVIPEKCVGCGVCIEECHAKKLAASRDIIPALKAVRNSQSSVYALIAPSFLGQFSKDVTPGKLRSAFKEVGFTGMIEVALFADILTLKEALEFDRSVASESDYQLTSCCCPMWIALIRKIYKELMPHVPGSVSPMIACGRTVKKLYPEAVTIFVGPCIAKKAEAREADIARAVDFVLTFQEVKDIFDALEIKPEEMQETHKDHSSRAGRIYAYAGGVGEAVQKTLEKINPNRNVRIITRQADGIPNCREMINEIKGGNASANFFEGMGCKGGCIGGPKVMIKSEQARSNVISYADEAAYETPVDNPYVYELLKRLGFDSVESLLEKSDIFTRDFSV